MSRDIPTLMQNVLGAEAIDVFFAVKLEFDSGTVRLWSGYGEKTLLGETYTGAGTLLQISDVEETAELSAAGVTLTLSGGPLELEALALSEPYQGRPAKVYFGVSANGAVAMTELFTATMDTMDIEESAETTSIQLQIENNLVDLERARVRRYTNNFQQSRFPGDRGLEFVEDLQTREIIFGRAN